MWYADRTSDAKCYRNLGVGISYLQRSWPQKDRQRKHQVRKHHEQRYKGKTPENVEAAIASSNWSLDEWKANTDPIVEGLGDKIGC